MSDYHIRRQSLDLKTVDVVFHVSIPGAGTNDAGLQWRDAVVMDLGGANAITSVLPEVQGQAEETSMKAGAIVEIPENLRFSSTGLSNPQRLAEIQARHGVLTANLVAEKQIELAFTGLNGDAP